MPIKLQLAKQSTTVDIEDFEILDGGALYVVMADDRTIVYAPHAWVSVDGAKPAPAAKVGRIDDKRLTRGFRAR